MFLTNAVFFDRDGVLIEDTHLLTRPSAIRILESVSSSLHRLKEAGFLLIVVTNQTVISRGLATEQEVDEINKEINRQLKELGSAEIDDFYVCPHHPSATLVEYRIECNCRKPQPGMLLSAKEKHKIDLSKSYMIGDRITDIFAGAKVGCKTILLQTGKHTFPPIETGREFDLSIKPDFATPNFNDATDWLLEFKKE